MTTLMNGLCQGALLVGLIWLLLKMVFGMNAATRYAIWWITLIAVVILPLRPLIVGAALPHKEAPAVIISNDEPIAASPVIAVKTAELDPVAMERTLRLASGDRASSSAGDGSTSWIPIHLAVKPVSETILGLWGIVSLALVIRLAIGFSSLRRLKRRAGSAPEKLRARLSELKKRAGVYRGVKLLVSDDVTTPMALGLFDAVILIPRSLPEQMSGPDFDHVALHELAHLGRYDDWANLLQQLLIALMPVQPGMFWIGRELAQERERACDDWVIAVTGTPKPYAASLTRIAELTLWARCGVLASGVAGRPSQLYRRISRLLDKRRNIGPRISAIPLVLAMAAVMVLAWLMLRTPPMIALADSAPAAAALPPPVADTDAQAVTQPSEPGTHTKVFSVQPVGSVAVDVDLGNVNLTSWDQNSVRITVTQKGPGLAEFLAHQHMTMTQKSNEIILHTTDGQFQARGPSNVEVDYEITVPRKFDAHVKVGTGNVEVSSIEGALDAVTEIGNVDPRGMTSAVEGRTGAGNIEATSCAGSLRIGTGAGNIELRKISGSVEGRTGAGNVEAADCTGAMDMTAGDGNIILRQFGGPSVNARTGAGNVNAEILGPINANCLIHTGMGNIEMKLKQTMAANLSTSAGVGNVSSQFPMGAINGGGSTLRAETSMGNVSIVKQ